MWPTKGVRVNFSLRTDWILKKPFFKSLLAEKLLLGPEHNRRKNELLLRPVFRHSVSLQAWHWLYREGKKARLYREGKITKKLREKVYILKMEKRRKSRDCWRTLESRLETAAGKFRGGAMPMMVKRASLWRHQWLTHAHLGAPGPPGFVWMGRAWSIPSRPTISHTVQFEPTILMGQAEQVAL